MIRSHSLTLLIAVIFLMAIGVVMVFDTSAAEILDRDLAVSTHHAVSKQLLYALLGIGIGALFWAIGYEAMLKMSLPFLGVLTILLICCFLPGIGQSRNGAARWIGFDSHTMQPSEFVKIFLPLFAIHYIAERGQVGFVSFAKLVLIGAIPLLLILGEPDNGTTAIIILTLLTVCLITGVKARYWLLPMVIMMVVAVGAASQLPYVNQRVKVYLNPELDLLGRGHQPYQAKIATGSGGVLGRGLGESMQKLTYLPEAQNDYIAAIYAEETGFLGVMLLIVLYMTIAACGYTIAARASSPEGCYLAATLTTLICLQAFLNLGVVSGLMPSKGLNLPFISQGGSSLMANLAAVTLLLNIDWTTAREKTPHLDRNRRDRGTPLSRTGPR